MMEILLDRDGIRNGRRFPEGSSLFSTFRLNVSKTNREVCVCVCVGRHKKYAYHCHAGFVFILH